MADPTPPVDPAVAALAEASGDPAAFQAVYSALMARYEDSCRAGHVTQFADEVAALAVQTLGRAGRLQPAGGETRTEWGFRLTYDDGTVTEDECERDLAAALVRRHAERQAAVPGWRVVKAELIERRVATTTGPWQPVPTEGAGA